MLRTSELEYDLPEELVATRAAEPRDSARLMVVSRSDLKVLEHVFVRDIAKFLKSGDRLVLNSTRVLRARLVGKKPSGGKVEGPEDFPINLQDHGNPVTFRNIWLMNGAVNRMVADVASLPCPAPRRDFGRRFRRWR